MEVLSFIFSIAFLGLIISIIEYNAYKKSIEESGEKSEDSKEKEKIENLKKSKEDAVKIIKCCSVVMIISIVLLIMLNSSGNFSSSGSSSKWDSLTDSEKAWYERNYGGGKSQQYRDAIDSYKSSY